MDFNQLEKIAGKVSKHANSKKQLKKLTTNLKKIRKSKEHFVSKVSYEPSFSNDISNYAKF